jgi:hypothetical protein
MVEERHRKCIYNFQQLSYDPHEWDFASWGWTGLPPQRTATGEPSPPVALNAGRSILRYRKIFKRLAENPFLRPILYQGHRLLSGLSAVGSGSLEGLYQDVAKIHAEVHCGYTYGKQCASCAARDLCDGFHGDYVAIYGCGEICSFQSNIDIASPLHYVNMQSKAVLVP